MQASCSCRCGCSNQIEVVNLSIADQLAIAMSGKQDDYGPDICEQCMSGNHCR